MTRWRRRGLALALMAALLAPGARAETDALRVAKGFGLIYLPAIVAEDQHLIERRLEAAGLGAVAVSWSNFAGGTQMNDALLSGNVDVANGGAVPFMVLWARSRGEVRAIAQVSATPQWLNTSNPAVKTVRDFTEADRIAVPAIKTSSQALTLQMAAEQAFGPGQWGRLDSLTVSMAPPDSHAALLAGRTGITAVFTTPPFMYDQLRDPRIHRVLSSFEVLGGPHTGVVAYATQRFRERNPKVYGAFRAALEDAMAIIRDDPKRAAEAYLRSQTTKETLESVLAILRDPESVFTPVPRAMLTYAAFMHRVGLIPQAPASWKELFFPELHDAPGS